MKLSSQLWPLLTAAVVTLAIGGVRDSLSNEPVTASVIDVRGVRLVDGSGAVRGEFALDGDDTPTLTLYASDGTKRVVMFATDAGCWLAGSTADNSGFSLTAVDRGSMLIIMDAGLPRLSAGYVVNAPSVAATSASGEVVATWP